MLKTEYTLAIKQGCNEGKTSSLSVISQKPLRVKLSHIMINLEVTMVTKLLKVNLHSEGCKPLNIPKL